MQAGGMDEDDHGAPLKPQAAAQRAGGRSGAVAVIPVVGTIMQRSSMMMLCDGGTSTQAISKSLREAQADDTVGSILLDIDSPGGSVYGVAELAAEIRASSKPVIAVANSLAASAAYWIGCAASEFYCSPGGEVGSIGVWMAHEDWSKALDEAGVVTTLISAGKFKTEGNPYGPLGDDAKAFLQSRTDDYYGAFSRDVAKGRKVSVDAVRGGMGQGRVLGASQAQAENMIDGVMTFDQAVRQAQRAASPAAPRGRSAEQRRVDLQLLEIQ
jgi:signal peptide peptidase SppA